MAARTTRISATPRVAKPSTHADEKKSGKTGGRRPAKDRTNGRADQAAKHEAAVGGNRHQRRKAKARARKANGAARAYVSYVSGLEPDREQLKTFVEVLFKHAGTEGYVSLRAFPDDGVKPFRITPVALKRGLETVIETAIADASLAANAVKGVVFCPPIAVFSRQEARERTGPSARVSAERGVR